MFGSLSPVGKTNDIVAIVAVFVVPENNGEDRDEHLQKDNCLEASNLHITPLRYQKAVMNTSRRFV